MVRAVGRRLGPEITDVLAICGRKEAGGRNAMQDRTGRHVGRYLGSRWVWVGRRGGRLTRQAGRRGCRHGTCVLSGSCRAFRGSDREGQQPRGTPEGIAMASGIREGMNGAGGPRQHAASEQVLCGAVRCGTVVVACVRNGRRETGDAGDSVTLHLAVPSGWQTR